VACTPLTRLPTATTLLDGQTTNSLSLGGPEITQFSPIPMLLSPMRLPHGSVHAWLQWNLAARDSLQRLTAEDPAEKDTEKTKLVPLSQGASLITYVGMRSHANSQDSTQLESQPNTQSHHRPSNSILAHLKHTPAVDATHDVIMASRAEAVTCSRIHPRHTEPSAPPKSSGQKSSRTARPAKGTSRRLDPMSAARANLVDFNKRCAQGDAQSFVQSATRQNERTGRCALREDEIRSPNELLHDNEEDHAHDEALQMGRQPVCTI
jgi:hypothetical protein